MQHYDDERACNVEQGHDRHQLFGNSGNALQTADDDKAVTTIRHKPVTRVGTPKAAFMLPAMELIWLMLPMPKEARMQKQANSTASTLPSCLQPFFAPSHR